MTGRFRNRRAALVRTASAILSLCVAAGTISGTVAASTVTAPPVVSSYTSTDNGDGTYRVPLLNADVPDISVARVPASESGEGRDVYYMVSTTMHLSPGAPIMKSYDLVNWEIVNHVFNRASVGDAMSRETPIPFYGELGSLNPVFVTPGAAARRAADIADGYVNSFTLGVGQFRTKPGLLFLPSGSAVLERLAEPVRAVPYGEMLNDRIRRAYARTLSDLAAVPGVRTVVDAADGEKGPVGPTTARRRCF